MRVSASQPILASRTPNRAARMRGAVSWRRLLPDPLSLLGFVLLLGLWQLAHYGVGNYFPSPLAVAKAAVINFSASHYFTGLGLPEGGYLPHLLSTTLTVLAGIAVGGVVGTATGLASATNGTARQIFAPLVAILGTVPILVAAPFFLIWFGLAESSKVILSGSIPAVVLHTYSPSGARQPDAALSRIRETSGRAVV